MKKRNKTATTTTTTAKTAATTIKPGRVNVLQLRLGSRKSSEEDIFRINEMDYNRNYSHPQECTSKHSFNDPQQELKTMALLKRNKHSKPILLTQSAN